MAFKEPHFDNPAAAKAFIEALSADNDRVVNQSKGKKKSPSAGRKKPSTGKKKSG